MGEKSFGGTQDWDLRGGSVVEKRFVSALSMKECVAFTSVEVHKICVFSPLRTVLQCLLNGTLGFHSKLVC